MAIFSQARQMLFNLSNVKASIQPTSPTFAIPILRNLQFVCYFIFLTDLNTNMNISMNLKQPTDLPDDLTKCCCN